MDSKPRKIGLSAAQILPAGESVRANKKGLWALDNVTREVRKSLSLRGWQELAAWQGEHE